MGAPRAQLVASGHRHSLWIGPLLLLLAAALSAGLFRWGASRGPFWPTKAAPHPLLVIYEQYHSTDSWSFLHPARDPLFRGLCQSPGKARPSSADVDASKVLEILHDRYYQDLMCEYSGFFALTADFDRLHAAPWIGFQSWRARSKDRALTPVALKKVMHALESAPPSEEAFYFWSHTAGNVDLDSRMYEGCNVHHHGQCTVVYAKVLGRMYRTPVGEKDLPPMPRGASKRGASWAYMSYFIMPRATFAAYVDYVRMLFVAMDAAFYEQHHDRMRCPLGDRAYERRHCWCYVLERFVNIWVYHRGVRMVYVDHASGDMEELHPVAARRRKREWFDPSVQAELERNFTAIAGAFPHGLELYRRLFLQGDGVGRKGGRKEGSSQAP